MAISLGELAATFDCELRGDAELEVSGVGSLSSASATSVSFLTGQAFKQQLADTKAAAVILRAGDADDCPTACLIHDNPYACYARVAALLHPAPAIEAGVHDMAFVAATAKVSSSAQIAAQATVCDGAVVGANCYVGPGCVVGEGCEIGSGSRLLANVTLMRNVTLGARVLIHPGTVIGCDGFGNAMTPEGWVKVPQLGGVRIGDDVEIGANCTIDLGAVGDTVIDNGVRLDNLVHVAHNVKIGEHTAVAGQCGFAGSAVIGKRCMFGGQAGVVGHISICDDVIVWGQGMVTKNITEPGTYGSGFPAEPVSRWNRTVARIRRMDKLIERVKKLEKDKT
jgi:UDP-3-O-[3-hydroxymyristoyl] glucosamine N-acyltransferase